MFECAAFISKSISLPPRNIKNEILSSQLGVAKLYSIKGSIWHEIISTTYFPTLILELARGSKNPL